MIERLPKVCTELNVSDGIEPTSSAKIFRRSARALAHDITTHIPAHTYCDHFTVRHSGEEFITTTMDANMAGDINPHTLKPYSASYRAVQAVMKTLPVFKQLDKVLDAVRKHDVVVLVGETGKNLQTPNI